MFARAEMKHYRLRGRGGEDLNEITICNAHMHSQTAARRVNNSAEKLRDFFDRLARACQKYDPRFICADLNMQLYNLVPEMRARGFCIHLAAFYVWDDTEEKIRKSDSCGIFRIGPCRGVRMCYDANVLGFTQTPLPANCKLVHKIVKNEDDQDVDLGPFPVESHRDGQGYPIKSYRPENAVRKEKLIENSFTPAFSWSAPAQEDMRRLALDKQYFPFGVDHTVGYYSWNLLEDKQSKQKLCDFALFDPNEEYFPRGAHAPLMCFMGKSSDGRRSEDARRRRYKKADIRGWPHERRQKTKQWSTSQSSTSQWSSSEWSSSEWNGAWSSSEWHGAWHSSESPTHGGGDQLVRD